MITVSLLARSSQELVDFGSAAVVLADMVEIRLDHAWGQDRGPWREAVLALGLPFVVSLHGPNGLGSLAGSLQEHVALLQEAAGWGASFVDVDCEHAHLLGELPEGCQRIVSMHVCGAWDGTWREAHGLLMARVTDTDRVKFVVEAEDAFQGLQVMAWSRDLPARDAGQLLFCMGEKVAFTRILSLAQGDPWAYAAPPRVLSKVLPVAARGQLDGWQMGAMHLPLVDKSKPRYMAVLGHPVEHSLSPEIQGAALREADLPVSYMAIDPGGAQCWRAWLEAAADFGFEGFAVTAPFKTLALQCAETATEEALAVGAANTLVLRNGTWHAHNTDVAGVRKALEAAGRKHAGSSDLQDPKKLKALILGAGGAARAVRKACATLGMAVDVCVRRPEAGEAWVAEFGGEAHAPWQAGDGHPNLIINTTPLGWHGRGMPLPPSALHPDQWVLDGVYGSGTTPLLWEASRIGASTLGGRAWFLAQAIEQFEWLLGSRPDVEAMEAALETGLMRGLTRPVPKPSKALALIGMRAVGKTTLGRVLAQRMGRTFVDADEALVETYRALVRRDAPTTAGQVLQQAGLDHFRHLERETLVRLLCRPDAGDMVIATGGGVVETEECRDWLREHSTCIWLDLPISTLQKRLERELGDRPPLTDPSSGSAGAIGEVPGIYARRLALYADLAEFGLRADGFAAGELPDGLIGALQAAFLEFE
ncbi:MAG: type I 3-dehydroquinate dehydratase [bacterium]|nr:type I 3-dehydroquinate dehydratase [bacterium]